MTIQHVVELTASATVVVPVTQPRNHFRLVTAAEFIAAYKPLEFVVDGLIPRGSIQSWTGPTGHAKTAVATLLQLCIACGHEFAGREVTPGRVLVLCGENPADYRLRLISTAQALGIQASELSNLFVLPFAFAVTGRLDDLFREVERCGPLVAVFVDTSAAYFAGSDENSNTEMKQHASALRGLCTLPGEPAVIVLCHPTKQSTRESLLPRGGGAFLAEVDGNLTVWKERSQVTLHWAGKLRGPDFEPISFSIDPCVIQSVRDAKGRQVVSVVASWSIGGAASSVSDAAEVALLRAMCAEASGSVASWAKRCGWVSSAGEPRKSKVARLLQRLESNRLVVKGADGRWHSTAEGRVLAHGAEVAGPSDFSK